MWQHCAEKKAVNKHKQKRCPKIYIYLEPGTVGSQIPNIVS